MCFTAFDSKEIPVREFCNEHDDNEFAFPRISEGFRSSRRLIFQYIAISFYSVSGSSAKNDGLPRAEAFLAVQQVLEAQ